MMERITEIEETAAAGAGRSVPQKMHQSASMGDFQVYAQDKPEKYNRRRSNFELIFSKKRTIDSAPFPKQAKRRTAEARRMLLAEDSPSSTDITPQNSYKGKASCSGGSPALTRQKSYEEELEEWIPRERRAAVQFQERWLKEVQINRDQVDIHRTQLATFVLQHNDVRRTLERQLASLETKVQDLMIQKKELELRAKDVIRKLHIEKRGVMDQLDQAKSQLHKRNDENYTLKTANVELEARIRGLSSESEGLNDEKTKLEEEVRRLRKDNQSEKWSIFYKTLLELAANRIQELEQHCRQTSSDYPTDAGKSQAVLSRADLAPMSPRLVRSWSSTCGILCGDMAESMTGRRLDVDLKKMVDARLAAKDYATSTDPSKVRGTHRSDVKDEEMAVSRPHEPVLPSVAFGVEMGDNGGAAGDCTTPMTDPSRTWSNVSIASSISDMVVMDSSENAEPVGRHIDVSVDAESIVSEQRTDEQNRHRKWPLPFFRKKKSKDAETASVDHVQCAGDADAHSMDNLPESDSAAQGLGLHLGLPGTPFSQIPRQKFSLFKKKKRHLTDKNLASAGQMDSDTTEKESRIFSIRRRLMSGKSKHESKVP